jgi:lactoylglutathione lyase
MKFCWTTLNVKNLEESLKFYQEIVGLPIKRRFTSGPDVEIVFLGDDETKLELVSGNKSREVNVGQDVSIGFVVESVDKMLTYLKGKGIEIQSGPFQPNPAIKFFYILDPDGLKVQFVENIKTP